MYTRPSLFSTRITPMQLKHANRITEEERKKLLKEHQVEMQQINKQSKPLPPTPAELSATEDRKCCVIL